MWAVNKLEHAGLEHMRLGELGEAERDLTQALEQRGKQHPDDPDHPGLTPAINNLAVLHLKQHRLEEAATGFRRVVRLMEDLQRVTPSSRTSLQIGVAKRNLASAERFIDQEAPPPPIGASVWPPSAPRAFDGPISAAPWAAGLDAPPGRSSLWGKARDALGSDKLKALVPAIKRKVARALGIDIKGLSEAELDEAIRRDVRGDDLLDERDEEDAIRHAIDVTFTLLDTDNNGTLSKAEVLKGLDKPEVQAVLGMGPFTSPESLQDVYDAIDTDGSNSIDRGEFVRHFMRKLGPLGPMSSSSPPAASSSSSSKQARIAEAAMKFMRAGQTHRERREGAFAPVIESDLLHRPHYGERPDDPLFYPHHARSLSLDRNGNVLSNPEMADLAMYDDLTRGLEHSQRRRLGLEGDIRTMQHELRAVEADIATKSASADKVRKALTSHRSSHGTVISEINDRLRHIDHVNRIANRPDLRTADRIIR